MKRRPSISPVILVALQAMLLLSLVLQPVLAAIGETHELTHAAAMQADGHGDARMEDGRGRPIEHFRRLANDPSRSLRAQRSNPDRRRRRPSGLLRCARNDGNAR